MCDVGYGIWDMGCEIWDFEVFDGFYDPNDFNDVNDFNN
jgi:hypothetical protein